MSKKILLVDDDLFIRDLYNEVLISEGYQVDTAADGKEGLEKLIANSYDLVLLDIMLPQIDGIGIIAKIQESKKGIALDRIVLLTNLANDPIVKQALSTGVHSCLTKADINPNQLVNHVKSILEANPSQSNSAETASVPE